MKNIVEYECEWCKQRFADKEECVEHERNFCPVKKAQDEELKDFSQKNNLRPSPNCLGCVNCTMDSKCQKMPGNKRFTSELHYHDCRLICDLFVERKW